MMNPPHSMIAWMQSLSDPTRARLLRVLERSELSVAELCATLQLPQSTVSRHLKVLLDDAWVVGRREGASNCYRMNGAGMPAPQKKLWGVAKLHCLPESTCEQDEARLDQVLESRRDRSQSVFSSSAGKWDRIRAELFGNRLDAWALAACVSRTAVVGDLGCGTGAISQTLAPWVTKVIAVDSSPSMIQTAKKRLKDCANVELRKGELTALPIDEPVLDHAILALVLPYLSDPEQVFREAHRVSRPGARLVVLDLLSHDRTEYRDELGHMWLGFSQSQIFEWMSQANWVPEHWVPIPPEPESKGTQVFVATAVHSSHGNATKAV